MNPTSHQLRPIDRDLDIICASIEFGVGLRHPLARAIRADKLALAALTATLNHYRKGEARSLLCCCA